MEDEGIASSHPGRDGGCPRVPSFLRWIHTHDEWRRWVDEWMGGWVDGWIIGWMGQLALQGRDASSSR
jgi:hypothetical protein